jgi:hypothetical protein
MTYRSYLAAERRRQRAEAKLAAKQVAQSEVRAFEQKIDALQSIHREALASIDWEAKACSLPPLPPVASSYNAFGARLRSLDHLTEFPQTAADLLKEALQQDQEAFAAAKTSHAATLATHEKWRSLGIRVLRGEPQAYLDAIKELQPLTSLLEKGWAAQFSFPSSALVECSLETDDESASPPRELKTLTTAGNLSVRAMPQGRSNELFYEHICSCVLRSGREIMALLPVETALVTVTLESMDPALGKPTHKKVLSVALPRSVLSQMDFDQVEPVAAVDRLGARCDFRATRKGEPFLPIRPLTPAEIIHVAPKCLPIEERFTDAQRLRKSLQELAPSPPEPPPQQEATEAPPQ